MTLEAILAEAVRGRIKKWSTEFHEEMEKAKSLAANEDIRIGLTHGQIIWGKIFESEQP